MNVNGVYYNADDVRNCLNKVACLTGVHTYEVMYCTFKVDKNVLVSSRDTIGLLNYMQNNKQNVPKEDFRRLKKIMDKIFVDESHRANTIQQITELEMISRHCSLHVRVTIKQKWRKICRSEIRNISNFISGKIAYLDTPKNSWVRSETLKTWRKFIDTNISSINNSNDARILHEAILLIENRRIKNMYLKKIDNFLESIANELSSIEEAKKAYLTSPKSADGSIKIYSKWHELALERAAKTNDEEELADILYNTDCNSIAWSEIVARIKQIQDSRNAYAMTIENLCKQNRNQIEDALNNQPEYWRDQILLSKDIGDLFELLHKTPYTSDIKPYVIKRIFYLSLPNYAS